MNVGGTYIVTKDGVKYTAEEYRKIRQQEPEKEPVDTELTDDEDDE